MYELSELEQMLVSGGAYGDSEDILVNGYRQTSYSSGFVYYNVYGSGGGSGSGAYHGGGQSTAYADNTSHDVDVNLTPTDLQQQAINYLKNTIIPGLDGAIKSADLNKNIVDADGNIISMKDVAAKWALADIVVDNVDYGPINGGVGATVVDRDASGNVTNVTFHINASGLVKYMGNATADGKTLFPGADKAYSYLLHELAHSTDAGQAMNKSWYAATSEGGGTMTQSEWLKNEQWAWSASRAIGSAINKDVSTYNPPQGTAGDFKVTGG